MLAAVSGPVQEKDGDPTAQLLAYCDEMASTAAWGGQMELGALAEVRGLGTEVGVCVLPGEELVLQYWVGDDHSGPSLRA